MCAAAVRMRVRTLAARLAAPLRAVGAPVRGSWLQWRQRRWQLAGAAARAWARTHARLTRTQLGRWL
jgi:hypothetical protein